MNNFQKLNNITGWLVWGIATYVYLSTIEPTASFWDCGEYIATSYKLEVGHPPGAPLFQMISRMFSAFVPQDMAAAAINGVSALSSSFTILFLFWTITYFGKKIADRSGELTQAKTLTILGSGVVGALAYTFSDSFWFSAVEGEVYAMSSLFTAMVFWMMLKWERSTEDSTHFRWVILIAFMMGLSIGVHLLNLLTIPAMTFLYYFKKYKFSPKGFAITTVISVVLLFAVQYGVIPGLIKVASYFELFFVNSLGMGINSGLFFFVVLTSALTVYGIYHTHKTNQVIWNTILLCFGAIAIGYSSYAMVVIRSKANTPMDENNPENAFALLSYLNREQYGESPLLRGPYFNSVPDPQNPYEEEKYTYYEDSVDGKPVYLQQKKSAGYNYDPKTTGIFPRMWSAQGRHISAYKKWSDFKGKPVRVIGTDGKPQTINKPTMAENLRFFFKYQISWMYWRYFMWNFAGRQNDVQGHGDILNGNWISGIPFIDEMRLGDQSRLPSSLTENKAYNRFYLLPFALGLLGFIFQLKQAKEDWWVVLVLFLFTGLAIIVFLNQYPYQPRERDYAYAASFYAYAVWIGLGVYAIFDFLTSKIKLNPKVISIASTVVCLLAVPVVMAKEGWDDHNRSDTYTARDFAKNYLNSCAKNAILFTNGDNDTFPLWYVQEVEGYRTDVRVINLSLLNTDWYIDQMRKKAYDSDVVPFSIPPDKYRQGTNDFLPMLEKTKEFVDVDKVIAFIKSDSPKTKVRLQNGQSDYVPAKNLVIKIDKAKVLSNGTVSPKDSARVLDQIAWRLDKSYILKNDLMVLDLLATNDWGRPIYFAITTGNDAYLGLMDYFQIEGLAYRLMPYKTQGDDQQTGEVNTDIMYDNLMNKFVWGGMESGKIYMNENNRRMTMNLRNNFSRLAEALMLEGKPDKAEEVLDRCLEVMPESTVPYNYFIIPLAEKYYKLNKVEKGDTLLRRLSEVFKEDLTYYNSIKGEFASGVQSDLSQTTRMLQHLYYITKQFNRLDLSTEVEGILAETQGAPPGM